MYSGAIKIDFFSLTQCRVQSEVDKVVNNKDYVGADDLDKLEYTEQVETFSN